MRSRLPLQKIFVKKERKSYKYQIQFDMWFPTSKISKNLEKAENAKWKEVMLFHKNI